MAGLSIKRSSASIAGFRDSAPTSSNRQPAPFCIDDFVMLHRAIALQQGHGITAWGFPEERKGSLSSGFSLGLSRLWPKARLDGTADA
jgi:hypothetical protein